MKLISTYMPTRSSNAFANEASVVSTRTGDTVNLYHMTGKTPDILCDHSTKIFLQKLSKVHCISSAFLRFIDN